MCVTHTWFINKGVATNITEVVYICTLFSLGKGSRESMSRNTTLSRKGKAHSWDGIVVSGFHSNCILAKIKLSVCTQASPIMAHSQPNVTLISLQVALILCPASWHSPSSQPLFIYYSYQHFHLVILTFLVSTVTACRSAEFLPVESTWSPQTTICISWYSSFKGA